MNKTVEIILNKLIEEPYFRDFKIRKSDSSLIKKNSDGYEKFSLPEPYHSIDPTTKILALQVYPMLGRRFDVLHKWFEKYTRVDIRTLRGYDSVYFRVFDLMDFYFDENNYRFEEQYALLRNAVVSNANDFFEKNSTLEKLYQNKIVPILKGNVILPDTGADWIFEYLKLTWIVDKVNYHKLKALILKRIEYLMFGRTFQEPNIAMYYDRLDEIFADIENS